MQRLRLYDLLIDRLPSVIGACSSDIPTNARYVNAAQRRLLMAKEAGDEGWWGTWAEMAFIMSRTNPYLTLPREVARVQSMTVCDYPVAVQNQFYEYLNFGNGRLPKTRQTCLWPLTAAYSRNNVPTFVDLSNAPQQIQVFCTESVDMDRTKRVLIQGTDSNGSTLYSDDNAARVLGEFLTLDTPFATFPHLLNAITGIQKDVTKGQVQFFQVDPTTGAQTLLLTMEPGETTAGYRRYYLDSLPVNCCNGEGPSTTVAVKAIVKLELISVVVPSDYCLIQNPEAIIEEAAAVRFSESDTAVAKQMEAQKHQKAIGLLNGELAHYLGMNTPAVSFKPFGSARLETVNINMR